MTGWSKVRVIPIGGVVAVGFEQDALAVGSHSGLGVFDAESGELLHREADTTGDYAWYHADPASIRLPSDGGVRLIPAAGIWGGALDHTTDDGWWIKQDDGDVVVGLGHEEALRIETQESIVAAGFSPTGTLLVAATPDSVHVYHRSASAREMDR